MSENWHYVDIYAVLCDTEETIICVVNHGGVGRQHVTKTIETMSGKVNQGNDDGAGGIVEGGRHKEVPLARDGCRIADAKLNTGW